MALPDPLISGSAISVALIGVGVSALICIPELLAGRWPRTSLDWLLAGYVVIVLLTGVAGVDPNQTLRASAGLACEVGLFYSAVIVARGSRVSGALLMVLVIGAAIVELLAFGYHLEVGLGVRPLGYVYPDGWSGYPELGALATLEIGILIACLLCAEGLLERICLGILALAASIQILFLYSRGTWVAALVIGAAAVVLAGRHRKYVLIGSVIAVVLMGTLMATSPTLRPLAARLTRGLAGEALADTATPGMRIKLWRESLEMIRDHPFRGVGLGNFRSIFESRYNPEINADNRRGVHAHNLWLQRGAELGIPGGLVFAALWVAGLWLAWRSARDHRGVVTLGIFLALAGTTVSNGIDNVPSLLAGFRVYVLTWILFGLAAASRPIDGADLRAADRETS